jgi:protein SCO1/2
MKIIHASLTFLVFFICPAFSYEIEGFRPGIDEKLGRTVPLHLTFTDEEGAQSSLREMITRPVVLLPIYYDCRHICPEIIAGLSEAVEAIDLSPGEDFNILTFSFDDGETTELARRTKINYLSSLRRDLPWESWKFLTGDIKNIKGLTDAIGFRFKKEGDGFLHPATLVILSAEGRIIRYLYGSTFLPRDLSMAIYEASQGRPGKSAGRLLQYCFSYDPEGKRYVFNILKVAGTVTILFLISFIIYLNVSNRLYRRKNMTNAGK